MSILELGGKPVPDTRNLVVSGPLKGESEIAAWPRQNPAINRIVMPTRQACLLARVEGGVCVVIEISCSVFRSLPSPVLHKNSENGIKAEYKTRLVVGFRVPRVWPWRVVYNYSENFPKVDTLLGKSQDFGSNLLRDGYAEQ